MDSKKDNSQSIEQLISFLYKEFIRLLLVSFIGQSCYNVITPGTTQHHIQPASSSQAAGDADRMLLSLQLPCVHYVHVYIYRSATTTAIDQNSPSEPILQDMSHKN